eukprot:CAMPEP_0196174384 /NCGR_PEP_ID=MMETSP0911-20130528/7392_1 /TAXON_ID=49265 /ORGANISM="Thalassiosira rotula, Strain GSO102" /LENGTH=108 /DNA_ID=CAMNT_0041441753 /DNA_START=20 /DNA_END=342 /DNA_ORIENTATION=-
MTIARYIQSPLLLLALLFSLLIWKLPSNWDDNVLNTFFELDDQTSRVFAPGVTVVIIVGDVLALDNHPFRPSIPFRMSESNLFSFGRSNPAGHSPMTLPISINSRLSR